LAGGSHQYARLLRLGKTQRIVRTVGAHLQGLDGYLQVIDRAGRRCEMQDIVQRARNMNELGDIVVVKLKLRQREQVLDVAHVARNQVVHADDMESFLDKPVAQVRTEETGRAGNKHSFFAHAVIYL